MYRYGWRTLLARVPYVVPAGRLRVAALVAVGPAVLAVVIGTVVIARHTADAGPVLGPVAVVLLGLGGAMLGAACAPFGPYGVREPEYQRIPERDPVERYFEPTRRGVPLDIAPEHRAFVLERAGSVRDRAIPVVIRSALFAAAWLSVVGGAVLLGAHLWFFAVYWVYPLGVAARGVARIGRAQRANDVASAMPPEY